MLIDKQAEEGISADLQRLLASVRSLHRGKAGTRFKPHKPVMLLTLLDLMETGHVRENHFELTHELERRFTALFEQVAGVGDLCQVGPPFFHLRSDGFWFHKPCQGKEREYFNTSGPGGWKSSIMSMVEYGFFDPDTYALLLDARARQVVRGALLTHYFCEEERERLRRLTHGAGA